MRPGGEARPVSPRPSHRDGLFHRDGLLHRDGLFHRDGPSHRDSLFHPGLVSCKAARRMFTHV